MRLHTSLTREQINDAFSALKREGKLAQSVLFDKLEEHKSRTHPRAFEIQLSSYATDTDAGEKRRRQNGYGVSYKEGYSATWSEWGWLMAALYEKDQYAEWYRTYFNADDFHEKTEYVFGEGIEHVRVRADELEPGDNLIGSNIQGSGVKYIGAVEKIDSRKLTLTVSQRNWVGGYFNTKVNTRPGRLVWVAREAEAD